MKVGIITFHRADNYGAMLQCYALCEYIKQFGHNVEIIDYRNRNLEKDHEVRFKVSEWLSFFFDGHLRSFVRYIPNYFGRKYRRALFAQFRTKFFTLSKEVKIGESVCGYDRIIIGSDQMWTIGCYKQFDPFYWGNFQREPQCRVYGYAISSKADFMMHLSIEQIKALVEGFDGLSFREQKIADLIQCITGKSFPVTLDPTLLLQETMWNKLIDNKWANRNYVVVYYVRGEVSSIVRDAMEFSKLNHYEVVNLASKSYSIEDFVSAIKFAKAVFTSSFHATCFSVIFNRPFNAYRLHDGNDDRYANLLEQLGLSDNLVDIGSSYHVPCIREAEFVEKRLAQYRDQSIAFLGTILN